MSLSTPEIKGGDIDLLALLCMVVFFAAIFAVGIYATLRSRSRHSTSDLILANRDIGLVFGVFTTTATWMGGPTIMGTAEYVFTPGLGLWMCIAPVGYSFCLALGGLLFAKKMRQRRCVTLYDPFLKRFGTLTTTLLFIPALMGDIFWSAAVLLALGSTVSVLVELDIHTTMIAAAVLVVIYTLFGGLYSVAYTDVIQLIFFFCGLWLCVPFALKNAAVTSISLTTRNVDALPINMTLKAEMTGWVGSLPSTTSGVFSYIDELLLLSLGGIPWQSFFQRILSSKSPTTARTVSLIASVMCLIIAIPAVIIGAVAVSTDWSMTDYPKDYGINYIAEKQRSLVLPLVMKYLCPYSVSLLGLGAIAAAAMSSADSSYLAAASIITHDIYTPLRNSLTSSKINDTEKKWVLRICIVLMGVASTCLAISVKRIYQLLVMCSDLVYVILFPALFCVVYVPWVNAYGALFGYIVALLIRSSGGESTFNIPAFINYPWKDESGKSAFPFRTLAMCCNFVCTIVFSKLVSIMLKRLPSKYNVLKVDINTRNFDEYEEKEIECITTKM